MIGRKRSTEEVVSSIITAREKVILVDPASIAVAPKMDRVEGVYRFITLPCEKKIISWR
jgi:hypothetical protein